MNIFLSFSDQVTPLTSKNNIRIFLASKSEKVRNSEAQQKASYSYKIKCIATHVSLKGINAMFF